MWCITWPHKYTIRCSNTSFLFHTQCLWECVLRLKVREWTDQFLFFIRPLCVWMMHAGVTSHKTKTQSNTMCNNQQRSQQSWLHKLHVFSQFLFKKSSWKQRSFLIQILHTSELCLVGCELHHLRLNIHKPHLCPGRFRRQQTPGLDNTLWNKDGARDTLFTSINEGESIAGTGKYASYIV